MVVGLFSILTTLGLQVQWVWMLVVCRLLQGMTSGIYYVILSVYIKEFPPIELVGRFGPLMQLFFIVGMVYTYAQVYILDKLLPVATYWRIVFFMPVIILSVQCYNIHYKYPYDTPKYLIYHGKKQ
mgnify:CR=1 FL=1